MGSIDVRQRKDGTLGYRAQILIKRKGAIVHREHCTFDRKQAATAWMKKRETELDAPGGLDKATRLDPTFGETIDRYVSEQKKTMGSTKTQVLRTVRASPIAALTCSAIGSAEIIAYAQSLDVQPQTRSSYLSNMAAIFAVARPAWNYPLESQAMRDAFTVAKRLGLIGKSQKRERRPTLAELDKILSYFVDRQRRVPSSAPMQCIIAFALFSTRREDEITRMTWEDFDEAHNRILIRDLKNPDQTKGNDVWCDLPPEAVRIVKAMPRIDPRIFPYQSGTVSAAFTRTMRFLAIPDLRFHDLRHEGVSRLFELGWTIPHVATVSGHRSWQSLQRYAHIRQIGDKYEDWPWLNALTQNGGL